MSKLIDNSETVTFEGANELLSLLWRSNANHLIASAKEGVFRNIATSSIGDALKKAQALSLQGCDLYHGCAEFLDVGSRTAANATGAWGFWFDVDCGEMKAAKGIGYLNKKEARNELVNFLTKAKLPVPNSIVDSGNGLHIYFFSDVFIPKASWQYAAKKLKALTKHHGFLADDSRTADIASVLRLPNTKNYKDSSNPKDVKALYIREVKGDIVSAINTAYAEIEGDTTQVINKHDLPIEKLGASNVNKPYPFTPENALEVLSAAKIVHPNIQNEDEFMIWGFECVNLIKLDGWPEIEVKSIFDAVCDLAPNANKTLNNFKFESFKNQAENYGGDPRRIASLFYEAKEKGWVSKETIATSVIETLNSYYAWVEAEASIYRLIYRDFISSEKFNAAHANQFTLDNNNKQITVAKKWIADPNRRQHKGIVTRPSEPEITYDGYLNNWKGYAVNPTEGDVTPFKNLYSHLFNDEIYPLLWIAHLTQNPGTKMYPSLVVWSTEEGVGKNLLFEAVQNIFPPEHATVISQSEVEDDFSGWIAGTVFAIADEIKAARSDKVRDKLKIWSTATTLRTHDKGQPKRVVPNLLNLVFLSNHADGMHLTDNDRRFFIWEVTAKPLPQNMINDFVKWRESGGLAHLLHYLQSIDIRGFDPKGRAPLTQAKADMVEASRSDLERWCKDVVTGSISLGREITTAEYLLNAFCNEYPNMKATPSVSYVGKTIARMGARTRKNQVRLSSGRKIRAIAIHRPDYWENLSDAVWRDEFEQKNFLASGVAENASPK